MQDEDNAFRAGSSQFGHFSGAASYVAARDIETVGQQHHESGSGTYDNGIQPDTGSVRHTLLYGMAGFSRCRSRRGFAHAGSRGEGASLNALTNGGANPAGHDGLRSKSIGYDRHDHVRQSRNVRDQNDDGRDEVDDNHRRDYT